MSLVRGKSSVSDWVYDAWDELVLDKGDRLSPEEWRRKWSILHGQTYVDGQWIVGVHDAGLVASVGASYAMVAGEYQVARDRLREFFTHPDLTAATRKQDYEALVIREPIADILVGNVEDGVERLRAALYAPNRKKLILNILRTDLYGLVDTIGLDKEADPRIVALVADVISCYRGMKRVAISVTSPQTNAQLSAALQKTFGR